MNLIRIEEAAQLLRLSVCTIRRLIASGEIPVHRLGKIYYFTDTDLQEYVNRCAIPAKAVQNAS
jgi:excisionase family DNA binding protein